MSNCSADPIVYAVALKKLQDLCSSTGEIPSSFILENVAFDRRNVVGRGGEASVYSGDLHGRKVVVREVVMSASYWRSPAGKKMIKVITDSMLRSRIVAHTISFSLFNVR